jgi:prepilin-type N-terminal cleavage/methylation domain-containing protein
MMSLCSYSVERGAETSDVRSGFTLAEVLAALTIGAMVLVAVLGIYSRAEQSATAILQRLDNNQLPQAVLQLIAEDLDKIIAPGADTKISVENKFEKGFATAQLRIVKSIYDKRNEQQTFEEIVWQGNVDTDVNSLVLFRSYTGMVPEDKLLDENRESWEARYTFVPICSGITNFRIQVPRGEALQNRWTSSVMPPGIVVTISFAEPFQTVSGTLDVPDENKIVRTIAIDRTRRIGFEMFSSEEDEANEQTTRTSKQSQQPK